MLSHISFQTVGNVIRTLCYQIVPFQKIPTFYYFILFLFFYYIKLTIASDSETFETMLNVIREYIQISS